jgi:hypothetical protein
MTTTPALTNALVSHVYRGLTYPPPTLYLGLLNASGVELSGSGYARAPVGSAFPAPTNGASTNNASITFPSPSTAEWAPALFVAFYDAPTGGNLLQTASLSAPLIVQNARVLRFPPNKLTVAFGEIPDGTWEDGNLVPPPDQGVFISLDFNPVWDPADYAAFTIANTAGVNLAPNFS